MKTIARPGQPPLASIIIPVFNKCDLTVQCLTAIAEVTGHIPHEIIVVDNASSDATPQRMRHQPPHIRYLRNEVNRNFAGACNQGAAAAAGKYLMFLNNDTIPLQGWLDALLDEVRAHPEVAALGSRLLYESGQVQHAGVTFARETRSPMHPCRMLRLDDPRANRRRELQAVTAACVMFRPKWFKACGGFSEDYRNGYEDLDLCLKIRQRGGVIVYQPKSVVVHLESQTPGRMKFDNENRALFFQRWQHAALSDEDAYYYADGCYRAGLLDGRPEAPRLIRFANEAERAQWQRVAQCQTHAAQWQREEVARVLSDVAAWPQEASVRRWAGCFCRRLGLNDAAQKHFAAALALENSVEVRLLAVKTDLPPLDDSNPSWASALESGFNSLRAGDSTAAHAAFDLALFHGAPPNLALAGLWRATNQQDGSTCTAELARQALPHMGRLDPATADRLQKNVVQSLAPLVSAPAKNDAVGKLVSIIILVLNQLELTRACLESVAAHTTCPHEIIVVDNGSTDGTPEFLKQWQAAHPNCTVIRNETNRGFAGGNNQGLAAAKGEILVLLNNDTLVTPGWMEGMTAALFADANVGLVGPVSNRVSGPQQIPTNYTTDAAMFDFAKSWREQNQGRSQPVTRLVGFCLLFKRAVLDAIGGLDESFGSGNFEDDDYCLRAKFAGFGSRVASGVFIHHAGSQTFRGAKIDYRQAMLRNWELFRVKWNLPANVVLERGYPVPDAKPESVALKVALPSLNLTHKACDKYSLEEMQSLAPVKTEIPAVARLGKLDEARSLFGQNKLEPAWNAARAAISIRPFHPEAFLLLAEIARVAGDAAGARACAQRARDLAPNWKTPKEFLKQKRPTSNIQHPTSNAAWLKLPESIGNQLSVCLIVKNEEQFLAQCLNSIQGLAQQIVVVDTGSTDRTVEIAKEHGAEVHSFAWRDDFSAARNAALEHATGDWVLMLDADEELPAAQHARLQADMKRADVIAFRLPLINKGEEAQGRHCVPRLFRNAPGVYYYSRIHEQVFPSLIQLGKAWGLRTAIGTAELLHHGYSKEIIRDRNKIERNLKLLRQAVVEFPNEPNLQMNLGLELVRSDDLPAGLVHYREAFRLMSAQPPTDVAPELREVLLTQFTCHLYKVRAHGEIVQALNSPLAKQGGLTASLHLALGLAFFELKQFREAAGEISNIVTELLG